MWGGGCGVRGMGGVGGDSQHPAIRPRARHPAEPQPPPLVARVLQRGSLMRATMRCLPPPLHPHPHHAPWMCPCTCVLLVCERQSVFCAHVPSALTSTHSDNDQFPPHRGGGRRSRRLSLRVLPPLYRVIVSSCSRGGAAFVSCRSVTHQRGPTAAAGVPAGQFTSSLARSSPFCSLHSREFEAAAELRAA